MGTYTELTVDGYDLIPSKSAVVPEIISVFRETDRKQFQQPRGGDPDEESETIVR